MLHLGICAYRHRLVFLEEETLRAVRSTQKTFRVTQRPWLLLWEPLPFALSPLGVSYPISVGPFRDSESQSLNHICYQEGPGCPGLIPVHHWLCDLGQLLHLSMPRFLLSVRSYKELPQEWKEQTMSGREQMLVLTVINNLPITFLHHHHCLNCYHGYHFGGTYRSATHGDSI